MSTQQTWLCLLTGNFTMATCLKYPAEASLFGKIIKYSFPVAENIAGLNWKIHRLKYPVFIKHLKLLQNKIR